jgi:hypothetical protein
MADLDREWAVECGDGHEPLRCASRTDAENAARIRDWFYVVSRPVGAWEAMEPDGRQP